jgi:hypothetical protein
MKIGTLTISMKNFDCPVRCSQSMTPAASMDICLALS